MQLFNTLQGKQCTLTYSIQPVSHYALCFSQTSSSNVIDDYSNDSFVCAFCVYCRCWGEIGGKKEREKSVREWRDANTLPVRLFWTSYHTWVWECFMFKSIFSRNTWKMWYLNTCYSTFNLNFAVLFHSKYFLLFFSFSSSFPSHCR